MWSDTGFYMCIELLQNCGGDLIGGFPLSCELDFQEHVTLRLHISGTLLAQIITSLGAAFASMD